VNNFAYRYWDALRGFVRSRAGGWKIGKGVTTYGYSLLDDIVGHATYFELLVLSVSGKMPEPRFAKWVEAIYSCLSFPDPRIWCNQVGALAGSMRTPSVAGITAGIQAADSTMYGPGTAYAISEFFSSAMEMYQQGMSIQAIVEGRSRRKGTQPILPGYGRPIATGDERVIAMNKVTENLGFEPGPFMKLGRDIDRYMLENYGESMNLATFTYIFLRDQQWEVEKIRQLTSLIVAAGVAACYSDTFDKPVDSFLPLRCEDIEYCGAAPRPVPEKTDLD
jgi:citrate synthase